MVKSVIKLELEVFDQDPNFKQKYCIDTILIQFQFP